MRAAMKRCIPGDASSSAVSARAASRRTGWPMVASLRMAMNESLLLLGEDERAGRGGPEKDAGGRDTAPHLRHAEAVVVQELAELMKRVDANRVLDLPAPSV